MRYPALACLLLVSAVPLAAGPKKHMIPTGSKIYFESIGNDFDKTLAAAFIKKQVPITIVTDKSQADYDLTGTTTEKTHKAGTKIAALAIGGLIGLAATSDSMKASIQIAEIKSSAVVFGYNVSKGDNPQSVAEACAKHIKDDAIHK